MTIKVLIKNVYGTDTIYPVCTDAIRFAALSGTKTLTSHSIRLIKELGYTIVVVTPTVNL